MQKVKTTLLSALLLSSTGLFAQWECPSRIGGNLKPFTASFPNLTWAGEFTTTAGSSGSLIEKPRISSTETSSA